MMRRGALPLIVEPPLFLSPDNSVCELGEVGYLSCHSSSAYALEYNTLRVSPR